MSAEEMQPTKIILDVDPGTDDAHAIMIALSHPKEVDLVAITCVGGNTKVTNATRNTLYILDVCERADIPVYKGAESPVIRPFDTRKVSIHGADGLGGNMDLPSLDMNRVESDIAAVALLRLASENKGNITLVATGPLTNLFLAHRLDSEFSKNLKHVFIMGGNKDGRGNSPVNVEFNFYHDPEAAFVVLNEFACPMTIVPWETCLSYAVPWDWAEEWMRVDTKRGQLNVNMLEKTNHIRRYERRQAGMTSCDGFAMTVALDASVIEKSESLYATIELTSALLRGMMIVDYNNVMGKKANVEIVTKLNKESLMRSLDKAVRYN